MQPDRLSLFPSLAMLCAVVTITFVTSGDQSATAQTAREGNLRIVNRLEDAFRNYDFRSQERSPDNVDWPVNLVFWGRANVNKVKSALNQFMPHSFLNDTKHARVDNGPGHGEWDSDSGRKDSLCAPLYGSHVFHYRVYAPPGINFLYNKAWEYYAIATSHIDHNECVSLGKWFGMSEEAEGRIATYASQVFGWNAVKQDYRDFGNREPMRREGNHHWNNDGRATFIRVP